MLSMDYIRNRALDNFNTTMRRILSYGGDTDTACAIVGALVGALHGIEGIENHITPICKECSYLTKE